MSAAPANSAASAEIPEIDRIAGFPHPRETSVLFGQEEAEGEVLDVWKSGRMHHAWLLTGAQGIGKATLAYRIARFLLAQATRGGERDASTLEIDTNHPVFRQVAARSHPDLLVLRRPWQRQTKRHAKAITIDEARRLRGFLGQTAAVGGWRVVIVDAADDLNISAANALLKSLEEPPESCIFLLVSNMPGRLPVTIRSRCRTLRLARLGESEMDAAIRAAFADSDQGVPEGEAYSDILALAQGSPGAALRLLAEDGAALYRQIRKIVGQLPRPNYADVHALADSLTAAGADARYELFHQMLADLLSRLISHAASGRGTIGDESALADRLMSGATLARWIGLWETLQREKAEADTLNLDRKILVLETFFRLERVAREAVD